MLIPFISYISHVHRLAKPADNLLDMYLDLVMIRNVGRTVPIHFLLLTQLTVVVLFLCLTTHEYFPPSVVNVPPEFAHADFNLLLLTFISVLIVVAFAGEINAIPVATTTTVKAPIVDFLKNVVFILLFLLICLSVMTYRWR